MRRGVRLEEISDGKLYGLNDMVKVGCQDCAGCSACCRGMGNSIVLDPLDVYRLSQHFHQSFEELLTDKIELSLEGGLILPHMRMDAATESCVFLNEEGRCSIHAMRPGLCRIFPLGRYYEGDTVHYILQTGECKKENRTKEKVKKWIATADIKQNERFLLDWHVLLGRLEVIVQQAEEAVRKELVMYVLTVFYVRPYDLTQDFYAQFFERMKEAEIRFPAVPK